jgi:hypothetical protein
VLQVLGGRDDGDRLDGPVGQQFGRDPQAERGLSRAGGRHGEEVLRLRGQVLRQRPALPRPQRALGSRGLNNLRVGLCHELIAPSAQVKGVL